MNYLIKRYLKRILANNLALTQLQIDKLRDKVYEPLMSRLFSNNLKELAIIYNCDKGGSHNYIKHYEEHFHLLRKRKLNILEIGVGGYEDPNSGGNSLRMWKRYFPYSSIFAIDIYDKHVLQEPRIKIFKGSQDDAHFLQEVYKTIGFLDIIIDDGSHENKHVIESFTILFPLLNIPGIYVIEDIQTSYWPNMGGNSGNLNDSSTSMNFFKKLTDCLNYEELLLPGYVPSYFDLHIISLHFYHNMVFVYKGDNREGSNIIKKNNG